MKRRVSVGLITAWSLPFSFLIGLLGRLSIFNQWRDHLRVMHRSPAGGNVTVFVCWKKNNFMSTQYNLSAWLTYLSSPTWGFTASKGPAELGIVDLMLCTGTFSSNTRLLFAVLHVRGGHFAKAENLVLKTIRSGLACNKSHKSDFHMQLKYFSISFSLKMWHVLD